MRKKSLFVQFAEKMTVWTGNSKAFLAALGMIIVWGATGALYNFSLSWLVVIDTVTSVTTFLMVFLIQSSHNRDSMAQNLKLDELIRATEGAHTVMLSLKDLNDKELESIRHTYSKIAREARRRIHAGKSDTDIPEVVLEEHLF